MHFCNLCDPEQTLSRKNGQRTKFWLLIIPENGQQQVGSR